MRIGIDVRPLQSAHRGAGIGTYTFNLVRHLLELHSALRTPDEWVWYTFRNRPPGIDLPNRFEVRRPQNSAHAAFWEQALLPLDMLRGGVDVFHATGGLTQVWEIGAPHIQPCRTIITVQDLHPLVLPHFAFIAAARAYKWQMQAIRKAARVIAVSHNTKRDIMRLLDVPDEQIDVVYMAPGDQFQTMDEASVSNLLRPLHIEPPFVLYVGNYNAHKNVETLLEAWAQTTPVVPLVIVGRQETYPPSFLTRAAVLNRADAVRFIGGLAYDSPALVALYNVASVFVFPSMYEGFGLPVVEAMRCGCPVIASNRGSLPEVAGDAGVLVEPEDVAGLAAAIQQALDDDGWRETLRTRGFAHVTRFDWRRAAEQTLHIYHEVGNA